MNATAPTWALEAKIPLGNIAGRIDHLAYDAVRQRLYVAELGHNSVGILDLAARRVVKTVDGFDEPQGIAYEPSTDTIYVANGRDGSVRVFSGEDFGAVGAIELGDDADNVRIDQRAHRVYVGYGGGALAVIDPESRRKLADVPLEGHPEGFQLDPAGNLVFVNVPDARHIAVVARDSQRQIASWPTGELRDNFPMALDAESGRVIVIFRRPGRLEVFDMRSGRHVGGADACGDADDVFVDPRRRLVRVICGDGYVDSFDASGDGYARVGRFATSAGARTGLLVPELDRLLVAVRATDHEAAAIWVLRPAQ